MSLQDSSVCSKDYSATKLTLRLDFFFFSPAHILSLPIARPQFHFVFPHSEDAVITVLEIRVYSQIPSLV